jgi:pimeloyl-ACP methyl ester carboxylesterase
MTTLSSEWQHHFVETNRIRLHYVTQGEGDLVLLLHGFPEFWYSWRHQIPALARHFKVVVPDLRGYNDSDKPANGYDLDTLAADIQGLIEGLGYSCAHIVGHDWGGAIAWHLAQRCPQYLNRLAILNAVPVQRLLEEVVSNLDQLQRSWYVFAFQVPWIPEWLIQQNLSEFIKNMFREQAIRKGAFSKEDAQIYQSALAKPGVLSSALSYYRHMLMPWNWLGNWVNTQKPVTVPTLVLWGQEDSFLSPNLTKGLEKFITAPFQLKLVPECGHWIQQEAPQTVNRELLNFLRPR